MRHTGGGRAFLTGEIQQAALYDRALDEAEVAASFRAAGLHVSRGEALAALSAAEQAERAEALARVETLRRGQSSPVHVLDAISRSVPDMLWLTQLDQKGADLVIEGRCMTLTSISDFVDNLGRSGWFKKPVEIVDSHVETGSATAGELIRFTVKAQVVSPVG